MSARPIDFGAPTTAPRRIGKYVVSHVLGEGAMGIVYKGIDPHIDRPVAIKTVRRQLLAPGAQDLSAALRFQREAKAAGRLSHPNIVPVYEYGEDGADLYIAMEYIEGSSLLNLTAHGNRLCIDDALSVMLQLLDALQCAHSLEVWHRDIKPGNLLITADGRLKVTDFGIARIDSAHLTQMNTVMGSPGYMAPERYTGDAPDSRVDLFSCGVVLYELLAGTAPFKGSVSEVMYQVLNRDPPPPSTLDIPNPPPACFDAVVAKAMARRAADRYASAIEMRDALFAASAQPIRRLLSGQTLARLRPPLTDVPTQFRQEEAVAAAAAAVIANAPTQWLGRQPVPPTTDQSTLPGAAGMAPFAPSAPFPANADAQTLTLIDRVLRTHLGPVSRYVLRDAARRLPDLAMLVDHITEQHVAPADREAFRRQIDAVVPGLRGAMPRAATQPAPAPQSPIAGSTPLRPEVVEQAQRLLATHIGPIASVVVRRASAAATSREQFLSLLVEHAGDGVDRKELMAQLRRLA